MNTIMHNCIDYLLSIGVHTRHESAEMHTTIVLNDCRVQIGQNWINVQVWRDQEDDRRGEWIRHSEYAFKRSLDDSKLPYFFDAIGVVPMAQFLNAAGRGITLDQKRAMFHLKEAIRKTA